MNLPFTLAKAGTVIKAQIGGSIGVALYPDHATEREALLIAADAAMYRVKRSDKSQCLLAQPPK